MPIRKRLPTKKKRVRLKTRKSRIKPQILTKGVCEETRLRIRILMAAYCYEFGLKEFMHDHEFDEACAKVDIWRSTYRRDLDDWFRDNFQPHTGQWIHSFPELHIIRAKAEFWSANGGEIPRVLKSKPKTKKKKRKRIV